MRKQKRNEMYSKESVGGKAVWESEATGTANT